MVNHSGKHHARTDALQAQTPNAPRQERARVFAWSASTSDTQAVSFFA
jgi:hypothetical protein